jgi:hypothetical protein
MLEKLKEKAQKKKKVTIGYRRENLLSHTGISSGYKNHPESLKNRTGEMSVVINF